MKTPAIQFDVKKLERLKKAYQKALDDGKDQFDFEGHPLLVGYAKYLIEFLTQKLG